MLKHVFTLVWNRRRANALILAELLLSFLVLAAVLGVGAYYAAHWLQPLGFDYEDVWRARVMWGRWSTATDDERRAILTRLTAIRHAVAGLDAVETTSYVGNTPYSSSTHSSTQYFDGRREQTLTAQADVEARRVLRLELVAGRWLEPGDDALGYRPAVINRHYARTVFGDADPVGRFVPNFDSSSGEPSEPDPDEIREKVIGVVEAYRRDGELRRDTYTLFTLRGQDDVERYPPSELLVRTAPGTSAAFEEELSRTLAAAAPDWDFRVDKLAVARRDRLNESLLPLLLASIICGFLILMVGMGLIGVLWQSVSRRAQELGLRRALGATVRSVRLQVLGELLALTTVAVALGSALFLQAPLLDLIGRVGSGIYLTALGTAMVIVYAFVVLCGLYPSWLATRVEPAEALAYE